MYYTKDFKELCKKVIKKQGEDKTCFLSFSTGKDSVATFLRCLETGLFDKFVLFYYFLIPEMSWIDEYLDYFEKKFGVEIIRVPNPAFYRMMSEGLLQTPVGIKALDKLYLDNNGFVRFEYKDIMNMIKEKMQLSDKLLCAIGIRSGDSMMRKMVIEKHGLIIEKQGKWYPIHDFSFEDIRNIYKKHDVKYIEDYELFGLTFDGLDYRFLKVIKDKKPEDYQRIKKWFPLIDLMIYRHEHYFGTKLKKSRFNYNK